MPSSFGNNDLTPSANLDKAASVECNKISMDHLREIPRAQYGGGFFPRTSAGFGHCLAAARGLTTKAINEHDDNEDGGIELLVTLQTSQPTASRGAPAHHSTFTGYIPITAGAFSEIRHPRKLLAAPLRLLRSASARDPMKYSTLNFLSAFCPDGGEIASENDVLVPNVAYTVTYLMTEKEFVLYRNMVQQYPLAYEVHEMLKSGGAAFDQINEKMGTFHLFVEGKDLVGILQEEVIKHRLGFTWDMAKSFLDPYKKMA